MITGPRVALNDIRKGAKEAKDMAGWADLETEDGRAEVARAVMFLADMVRDLTKVIDDLIDRSEN